MNDDYVVTIGRDERNAPPSPGGDDSSPRAYTGLILGQVTVASRVSVENLSFSSARFGGYWAAAFDMDIDDTASASDLIGREARVYSHVGQQVWEGFIDSVALTNGVTTITYGPLMNVSNSVRVQYRNYSFNVTPPVYNGDKEYPDGGWAMNTQSASVWGAMYEILAATREMSDAEAERVAGFLLTEKAQPAVSVDIGNGEKGPWRIHVECLGYFHFLKKRYVDYYSNVLLSADQVVATAIRTVGLLNATQLNHVAITMTLWNDEIQTAYDFIDSIFGVLDTSAPYGYALGVYDDRVVYLSSNYPGLSGASAPRAGWGYMPPPQPTLHISAATGRVSQIGGNYLPILPRPGDWLGIIDAEPLSTIPGADVFLVDSVEVSNGSLVVNKIKFSLLERFLNEKGV